MAASRVEVFQRAGRGAEHQHRGLGPYARQRRRKFAGAAAFLNHVGRRVGAVSSRLWPSSRRSAAFRAEETAEAPGRPAAAGGRGVIEVAGRWRKRLEEGWRSAAVGEGVCCVPGSGTAEEEVGRRGAVLVPSTASRRRNQVPISPPTLCVPVVDNRFCLLGAGEGAGVSGCCGCPSVGGGGGVEPAGVIGEEVAGVAYEREVDRTWSGAEFGSRWTAPGAGRGDAVRGQPGVPFALAAPSQFSRFTMDRVSILGDAIEYMKELLQRINDLNNELESMPSLPLLLQTSPIFNL